MRCDSWYELFGNSEKKVLFVVRIGAGPCKWFRKSSFSRKVLLLSVSGLALLSSISLAWLLTPRHPSSSTATANDPNLLLDRANYLSWLNNWNAAGPLYARAEVLFRADGDTRNELYARIGPALAVRHPSRLSSATQLSTLALVAAAGGNGAAPGGHAKPPYPGTCLHRRDAPLTSVPTFVT